MAVTVGAIQVLLNAVGGGRVSDFPEKVLRRCTIQHYSCYEGVGGCRLSRRRKNVTYDHLNGPILMNA